MPLEDYKGLVGTAAGICTIGQMFSGVFICKGIVNRGSTKNVSAINFLGGLVIGCLMMCYSLMLGDNTLISVNVAVLVIYSSYLLCYYIYCQDKTKLHFQAMVAAGFVMLMLGYIRWEDQELVKFRYGLILNSLITILISSPLLKLGEVVRSKSTASLPFPTILSGTLGSFLWLMYSIILNNIFMQVKNAVNLVLCLIQLSLFAIYPSKPVDMDKDKEQ